MSPFQPTRRQVIHAIASSITLLSLPRCTQREPTMVTLYTFGDSILDCARYNDLGVHPGQLLVKNDDRLFPEFQGKDLASRGFATLEHRARDGATVGGLPIQAQGLSIEADAIALITIGGNDLLSGLIWDQDPGIAQFSDALEEFVQQLPIRPVLLGNVYDPTFGDDRLNFLSADPAQSRASLQRINAVIAAIANRYGKLVDLHAHFLTGNPSWFTATIEPSLVGASEVRRAFLPDVLKLVG